MRAWKPLLAGAAGAVIGLAASSASAQIRITEWMYNDAPEEFVEFTNVGSTPIDMTGWSFDDDGRLPDVTVLSAFGIVLPGESVILAENASAADFRTRWGLPASVDVIGGNVNNLGRADEINIFDASDVLVDRLTYGDQAIPGSIRTVARSGGPSSLAAVGANDVLMWKFIDTGPNPLGAGFSTSTTGQTGNPGVFPEPGSLALVGLTMLNLLRRRRA